MNYSINIQKADNGYVVSNFRSFPTKTFIALDIATVLKIIEDELNSPTVEDKQLSTVPSLSQGGTTNANPLPANPLPVSTTTNQ